MNQLTRTTIAAFTVSLIVGAAHASVLPFTETFSKNNANWGGGGDWTTFAPLAWTAPSPGTGLPAGAGYVSTSLNLGKFDPGSFPAITLFRGQDNFGSSNNAFKGDWISSGIVEFSFMVRHDAPADLTFSVRFTPVGANSPSMNFVFDPIQSGQWSKLSFSIDPANPGWIVGGGPNTYNTVFGNLGKIQIGADLNPIAGIDETFTFDLSMVSIAVPAPGTLAVLALAGFARRRRRRRM